MQLKIFIEFFNNDYSTSTDISLANGSFHRNFNKESCYLLTQDIPINFNEQNKKDFIDRFGDVTSEITNLYELSKLKNIARKLNILSIKYRDENFSLKLADDSILIPPSSKIREIKVSAKDIKSDRLTFIMSKLESFLDKNEI